MTLFMKQMVAGAASTDVCTYPVAPKLAFEPANEVDYKYMSLSSVIVY